MQLIKIFKQTNANLFNIYCFLAKQHNLIGKAQLLVMPAKAGIHHKKNWTPACGVAHRSPGHIAVTGDDGQESCCMQYTEGGN